MFDGISYELGFLFVGTFLQVTTKTKTIPTIEARQSKTQILSTNNSQVNKSELSKLGSHQAHNQSDAEDKHTKHCEQGLWNFP